MTSNPKPHPIPKVGQFCNGIASDLYSKPPPANKNTAASPVFYQRFGLVIID